MNPCITFLPLYTYAPLFACFVEKIVKKVELLITVPRAEKRCVTTYFTVFMLTSQQGSSEMYILKLRLLRLSAGIWCLLQLPVVHTHAFGLADVTAGGVIDVGLALSNFDSSFGPLHPRR